MASTLTIREASHAGSWYSSSKSQLSKQLDGWLANVNPPVKPIGQVSSQECLSSLPVPGARVVIAPWVHHLVGLHLQVADIRPVMPATLTLDLQLHGLIAAGMSPKQSVSFYSVLLTTST